jgi:hypothetical protein
MKGQKLSATGTAQKPFASMRPSMACLPRRRGAKTGLKPQQARTQLIFTFRNDMQCQASIGPRRTVGEGRRKSNIVYRKFGEPLARFCRGSGEPMRGLARLCEPIYVKKNKLYAITSSHGLFSPRELLPARLSKPSQGFYRKKCYL